MNTCPKGEQDKGECYIKEYKSTNGELINYDSVGCDNEREFCKFVGDANAYNDYDCVPKLANQEQCDNSMQCMSKKCSKFIHKANTCYDCFANKTMSTLDYGKEVSNNHCDQNSQYCGIDDDTCHSKIENGEKCFNNNYMCKSNKCLDDLDICGQCLQSSDCENENQFCTADNICKEVKGDLGDPCSDDSQCHESTCHRDGHCVGDLTDGEECLSPYQCKSGICEFQLCGSITGTIDSGLPDDEENQAAMMKKYIGILSLSIILTMAIIIGCHCCKKKKNQHITLPDDLQRSNTAESIYLDDTPAEPSPQYRSNINGSDFSDGFQNNLTS